jgi:hypothetical protein
MKGKARINAYMTKLRHNLEDHNIFSNFSISVQFNLRKPQKKNGRFASLMYLQ